MLSGSWVTIGDAVRLVDRSYERDQDGKFSSGGGVRRALADASATQQLDAAAGAEAKRITGRDVEFDFTGSDVQLAREHAEGVLQGLERYPGTALSRVSVGDLPDGVLGRCQPDGRSSEIIFSRAASSPEGSQAYRDELAAAGERRRMGRTIVAGTPTGTALHEFGHAVANGYHLNSGAGGRAREFADSRGDRDQRRFILGGEVSRRALENDHELAAEAFADVMANGSKASGLSKAIVEDFDGEIRRSGTPAARLVVHPLARRYKRDKDGKFAGTSYTAGRDLLAAGDAELADGVVAARGSFTGRSRDPALSAIAQRQGFDGPPTVVSRAEMDGLIRSGRPHMLRGVQAELDSDGNPVPGGKTAQQIHEDLRSGDAHFGRGVYGNGYYFAPPKGRGFAGAERFGAGPHGAMVRATLRADAKVVKYGQLRQEHAAYFKSLGHEPATSWETPRSHQDLVFGDLGRFAAARGYDAVEMSGSKAGGYAPPQWLVLNRTALIVEEA